MCIYIVSYVNFKCINELEKLFFFWHFMRELTPWLELIHVIFEPPKCRLLDEFAIATCPFLLANLFIKNYNIYSAKKSHFKIRFILASDKGKRSLGMKGASIS